MNDLTAYHTIILMFTPKFFIVFLFFKRLSHIIRFQAKVTIFQAIMVLGGRGKNLEINNFVVKFRGNQMLR